MADVLCSRSFLIRLLGPLIISCVGWSQAISPDTYNEFPVEVSADGYRGETTKVELTFKILLTAGETTYVPIDDNIARILSAEPTTESTAGIAAHIASNYCSPQELAVKMGEDIGRGTGGVFQTTIDLGVGKTAALGDQVVRIYYPLIDAAMERLSNRKGQSPAMAIINLKVWASPQARQAAIQKLEDEALKKRRAEEEQILQAQKAQEEAQRVRDAEEKRQQDLDNQKRVEMWKASFFAFLKLLPIILLVVMIFVRYAPWLWPAASVTTAAGQHEHLDRLVSARKLEGVGQPGAILQTAWARGVFGRRQRLKVETFVSEDEDFPSNTVRKLDLLVSVGQRVRAGTYLARMPNGAVRIRVEG
jgi:hypothetical protein